MAITVTFYSRFDKRKNSTKRPLITDGTQYSCSLKDGCGVMNPVIEIYYSGDNPTSYNYAYIEKFQRYYFVSDWQYERGVWTAYLRVDVLATYRQQIRAQEYYCLRSSRNENANLLDTYYPPSGPVATNWNYGPQLFTSYGPSTGSFIIGFFSAPAGTINANSFGSISYFYATRENLVTIIRYLMSDAFINSYLVDGTNITNQIAKDFIDPMQWIASVMYFPFDARGEGILPSMKPRLGPFDMTNDSNFPSLVRIDTFLKSIGGSTYKVTRPANTYSDLAYMQKSPYCEYTFVMDPFGAIDLPADLIGSISELYYEVAVDLITGLGILSLGTAVSRMDVGIYQAQVGVTVPLSQITQDIVGAASSAAGGIAGAVGNLLKGDVLGAVSSVATGLSGAVGDMSPKNQTKGAAGSLLAYLAGTKQPKLFCKSRGTVLRDTDHKGTPYCGLIRPMSQATPTFYMMSDGNVDYACYDEEKTEIENYLTGGFYYE